MDKIVIQGGRRLKGKVEISGAKNSALPVLFSSILAEGWNQFENIPALRDILTTCRLLEKLGLSVLLPEKKGASFRISSNGMKSYTATYDLVRTMRASVLVMGPLLARFKKAKVSLPGGCAIGARPINLHLKAFEQMGAKIDIQEGYVVARAKKLHGARIHFDTVSVTGTENVMMAAVLAEGETIIENAAQEPEIADLAEVLIKMGGRISGAGTTTLTISGVKQLHGCQHHIIADRIEAGTFMIASAITAGNLVVSGIDPIFVEALSLKLREAGTEVRLEANGIRVIGPHTLRSVDVTTAPYPGFATDFQAQFMALMTIADGTSVMTETIFENRFLHAQELLRMGAHIKIEGHSAVIQGVKRLSGAPLMASDLRASAALILAGLAAKGITEIHRVYHIDRGYEQIEKKLRGLGARIKRVKLKY
ncbi:MAG: UDP-N-acetylglucosamine 1-carboxyvinyltransferase [Deltaproteobacteria bacterium]|nr:UDP-N-acetylglucosamine 1-carboxyvinyltransferase [Deltaproteobacteria bacterium]MBI2501497.1 UDP-N-acetylglucosamine 1-carboxyvinyltransferase [Deltaproteobacteria bacterium]